MYSTTGPDVSNFVSTFDTAFWFIMGVSLVLLVGITIMMLYFVYKYNRKKHKKSANIEGNTKLEIIWTVIPIFLVLIMFYFGWAGWEPMNKAPKEALNITTIARMWNFSFQYENGKQSKELIVPEGMPIKLNLVSVDVLHSVFIPAFRIKTDIVPGREKMMWFIPQRAGNYDLYCAEYCGLQHSYMNANLKVIPKAEFDAWYTDTTAVIAKTESSEPGAEGLAILKAQGCNACHSSDGSKIIGPSYLGIWGEQQVVVRDGKDVTVTVDSAYIRKSIYEPNAEIVKGYQKGLMQPYDKVLTDQDIAKIIEYLKTLKE
ncbi:MAG: cytochrome c oxidase subunit II [Bacteroidales bacterium]|nr:cytochrome c oxidase subunit II [Bacteroidales bacterium]MCB8999691.1 cytochrome c oxidase subunit II [Bacteroidales bacterium]